jgi:hypothetical protein
MFENIKFKGFIKETNVNYQKHKKVLLACLKSNTVLPEETAKYFGNQYPSHQLLEARLSFPLEKGIHVTEYIGEKGKEKGVDFLVKNLPDDVSIIRVILE